MKQFKIIKRFWPLALFLTLAGCFTIENGPILSSGDLVEGLVGEKGGFVQDSLGNDPSYIDAADRVIYEFHRALNGSYIVETPEADEYVMLSAVLIAEDVFVGDAVSEPGESSPFMLMVDRTSIIPIFHFCISVDLGNEAMAAIAAEYGMEISQGSYGSTTLRPETPEQYIGFMTGLWNASEPNDWECTAMRDQEFEPVKKD